MSTEETREFIEEWNSKERENRIKAEREYRKKRKKGVNEIRENLADCISICEFLEAASDTAFMLRKMADEIDKRIVEIEKRARREE